MLNDHLSRISGSRPMKSMTKKEKQYGVGKHPTIFSLQILLTMRHVKIAVNNQIRTTTHFSLMKKTSFGHE